MVYYYSLYINGWWMSSPIFFHPKTTRHFFSKSSPYCPLSGWKFTPVVAQDLRTHHQWSTVASQPMLRRRHASPSDIKTCEDNIPIIPIPPGSLTWPLKIYHPKRKGVFQPSLFRAYVKLREAIRSVGLVPKCSMYGLFTYSRWKMATWTRGNVRKM